MANWVTHLMIADKVLKKCTWLDRRGFCVGNIAPDCNVENEDWTEFTPPRAVTHWMSSERKVVSDCDAFRDEYIIKREGDIKSHEQYSFLLGYYSHLITDAAFQKMIRDEQRVKAAWDRIKADKEANERAEQIRQESGEAFAENWDFAKKVLPRDERMRTLSSMEAEYLRDNPDSGYLTEIMTLKEFPDYIDYLPQGAIVRKIGVMGYIPEIDENMTNPIGMSREELEQFGEETVELVCEKIVEVNRILKRS